MKKRLFSFLLSLALVFSLLPTLPAHAAAQYELLVCLTRVTDTNKNDILGNGRAKFDPSSNTLTLSGDLSANDVVIYSALPQLRIHVAQDSVLTNKGSNTSGYAIICNYGSLTIEGPGKLTAVGNDSISESGGIFCSESIRIQNATVEASGNYYGLSCIYDICIHDANVTARGGKCGIFADRGELEVANSSASLLGGESAFYTYAYGMTLTGEQIVEPAGGKVSPFTITDSQGNLATAIKLAPLTGVKTYPLYLDGAQVVTFLYRDLS